MAAVAMTAAIGSYADVPVQKVGVNTIVKKAVRENVGSPARLAAPRRAAAAGVDFTVKGSESAATVTYSENFNSGSASGWKFDKGNFANWTVKKITGDHAFTSIDPADAASLYIDGDYRVFNRETVSAVSPEVAVGQNATLNAYVGYSLNFDEYCRLYIAASTDDFENDVTELWNSGMETGEKGWVWHPVEIDLSALSGKTVKFRFTYGYGSADDIFKTGGYMGDFAVDNIEVRSAASTDKINVVTGEEVTFIDLAPEGSVKAWQWSFPGGTPATSTEAAPTVFYTADGTYDVTLTVTDASGATSSTTKPGFVTVTGFAPVAHIGYPATFRHSETRLPMIAPFGTVTYTDASTGFPTSSHWTFSGTHSDKGTVTPAEGPSVDVRYHFMNEQNITLEVENEHGSSTDKGSVTVAYEGEITNMRPGETAIPYFDMGDWGEFPGTNTHNFTKYAERFSKPSTPMVVVGAYVFFTNATAEEVADQIASVGVHICKSENGLPGEALDDFWWSVFELDCDVNGSTVLGTYYPFTYNPVVTDEFFIVVDGIPAKSETNKVSFAMSNFRDGENTAYTYRDGKWINVGEYFTVTKGASFLIEPVVLHSAMGHYPLDDDDSVRFGKNGGKAEYNLFSYFGWDDKNVEYSDDWVRIVSEPGEYTTDTLVLQADPLPAGLSSREAVITLHDPFGAASCQIPVLQDASLSIIDKIDVDTDAAVEYFNLQGVRVANPENGLFICRRGNTVTKVIVK